MCSRKLGHYTETQYHRIGIPWGVGKRAPSTLISSFDGTLGRSAHALKRATRCITACGLHITTFFILHLGKKNDLVFVIYTVRAFRVTFVGDRGD